MRRALPFVILLLMPACREIEEIVGEPASVADTIESGDFDRLWTAAKVALNRSFIVIDEDRRRGRILARGRPAESYVQDGERRFYSDTSSVVVEVRIDRQGAANMLSVRAAVERDAMGPDGFRQFSPRDRSYAAPALMRTADVEHEILRQIREEMEGKR